MEVGIILALHMLMLNVSRKIPTVTPRASCNQTSGHPIVPSQDDI